MLEAPPPRTSLENLYIDHQKTSLVKLSRRALARLISIAGTPGAATAMKNAGLVSVCKKLMARESTPDSLRGLAGSLITLLTDTPVSSNIADPLSGGYGHVTVVMPRPSRVY